MEKHVSGSLSWSGISESTLDRVVPTPGLLSPSIRKLGIPPALWAEVAQRIETVFHPSSERFTSSRYPYIESPPLLKLTLLNLAWSILLAFSWHFWALLNRLGASLGVLEASWKRLGAVLGRLGAVLGRLGGVLGRLEASWGCLGASWRLDWASRRPDCASSRLDWAS